MRVAMRKDSTGIEFQTDFISVERKKEVSQKIMERFKTENTEELPKIVNKLCWQCCERAPLGQKIYCGECLAKQSAAETTKRLLFDDLQLNPLALSAKQIWLGFGVFVIGLLLVFMNFCGPEKGTSFQTSTPKLQKEVSKK